MTPARLWPAAVFQFLFIAAVALMKPAANALTLSHFKADALPWLYLAASGTTAALAALSALRSGARLSPGRLVMIGAGCLVTLAFAVWRGLPFAPLLGYLFAEAFTTQLALSFWGVMSESFDAREARRAFGLTNGIGMGGAMFGGALAQVMVPRVETFWFFIVAAVMLIAGGFAFQFHRVSVDDSPARRVHRSAPLGQVMALPFARLLAGIVIGMAMLTVLVDFSFRQRAAAELAETGMTDLFASNQMWTGVFCVVFQLFVSEQLLRRAGILNYVIAIPAVLGAVALGAFFSDSVWPVWGLKLLEGAASWSLLPVVFQLLYAPLRDDLRDGVRRTIDGLIRKAGMGLAGVALLAVAQWLQPGAVLLLVVSLCVNVVVLLVLLRPRYLEALQERVAGVQFEGVADADEALLSEALRAGAPERALRVADLLVYGDVLTERHVITLLTHPHERVQERGVQLAMRFRSKTVARLVEAIIVTGERRPRDAAVWALPTLAPERALLLLPTLLSTHDIGLKTAAVGGLRQLGGASRLRADAELEVLLKRGPAAPTAERREVARLLGRLRDAHYVDTLTRYLDDSDATVRRLAIFAVGAGGYLELAPRLLRFLSWRDERRHARDALAALGDSVVPLLTQTLDDRTRALVLRLQIPRVLRRIGTVAAFEALMNSNTHDDPSVLYRVGIALSQVHDEHPEFVADAERVNAAIVRRRETYDALSGAYADARAALGEQSLLTRVLADRLDQAFELTFWLLGLKHDSRTMRKAHAQVLSGDARRRAWALELFEHVLSPAERVLISEQLEQHHRTLPPGDGAQLQTHVTSLCESDDATMRSVARAIARQRQWVTQFTRGDEMSDAAVRTLFALEGVEIFAQSDVDDLAAVATVAREQTFRAGQRLYAEGDPGDALYVMVEGRAEARRDGELVLSMGPKESFGETSLFDGAPRINEVVAVTDVRVLMIERRDFLDLIGDRPDLLTGMFRVLSAQMKRLVVEVSARRVGTGENLIPLEVK